MLSNYLKISIRNLIRYKSFSAINIFGLALSMSVCLLVIMLIKDGLNYDRFHPERDRIFRILTTPIRKDGRTERYASSPFILGKTLQEECPEVEAWTPLIRNFGGRITQGERSFAFSGMLTNASFFSTFGFELAKGDPVTALNAPYSIVFTHELAVAFFGEQNPLGVILEIPGYAAPFHVTGVLKPFAGKTHMEFTTLGSLETQYAEERQPEPNLITQEWRDYYQSYNFIKLRNAADKDKAEQVLANLAATKYGDLELESRDNGYQFSLQPLKDITPGPNLSNSMGEGMPMFFLWFLGILGLIVISSACFNYTNLTIARALMRTKEVGVRKVLGASRKQIFLQILGESVFTAFIALAVSYLMLKWIKPQFEQLSITEVFDMSMQEDWKLYSVFLLFSILIGVIAGVLPALVLSRTKPIAILQRLQNTKLLSRIGLRKALLTIQFSVTLIFIMTQTTAWRQTKHAIAVNFGFDQPQTLLVDLQGVDFAKAETALSQVSGVRMTSGISFPMGTWRDASDDVRAVVSDEKRGVRDYFIDHKYLEHFKIALVAGKNFPDNPVQQSEQFAIVNEMFVREFNLGDPVSAVGKTIWVGDSTQLMILGVTEDFPFKPATYAMEPLLLRYNPLELGTLNLELQGQEIPATVAALEAEWKTIATHQRFDGVFFDEAARATFSEALDIARIVGFFGFLGLVIACMGLLGLSIYMVESKAKEISIRKVMGATFTNVIVFLSKGYVWLFVIAICISIPISFLLGNQILQSFANRIPMTVLLFLPGVIILLLIAGITIGSQAFRAAFANPVEALRSE